MKPSISIPNWFGCTQIGRAFLAGALTAAAAIGGAKAESVPPRNARPLPVVAGHPVENSPLPRDASLPPDLMGNGTSRPDDFEVPPRSPLVVGEFVNFESPLVNPMALSADGQSLFVANTPSNSLMVLATLPVINVIGEIPVGLDPVSLAVQPGTSDSLVWVVNHISDSVSVVNVTTQNVEAVIEVGDEPVNVLFNADGSFAFVIIQGSKPLQTYELDSMNLQRGFVVTVNTSTREIVSTTFLDCNSPRAAVFDATNQRLIVAAFHSGNNTTVVGDPLSIQTNQPIPSFPDLFCEPDCACDCDHGTLLLWMRDFSLTSSLLTGSTDLGPTYPDEHSDPLFPMAPPLVQRIVPDKGLPSTWRDIVDLISDGNGAPDPSAVAQFATEFDAANATQVLTAVINDSYDTLDHDLVVLDVSTPSSPSGLPIVEVVSNVGTTLAGVGLNPANGDVFVSNLEPRNLVRHEPVLKGHFVDHQINVVSGVGTGSASVTVRNLHADVPAFNDVNGPNLAAQAASLAHPQEIVFDPTGAVGFFAALGPDRVGAIDSTTGAVLGRVDVGRGPRAVVLNAINQRLYVLNRTDLSISGLDVTDPAQMNVIETRKLFNPEPPSVRDGRHLLYSTRVSHNFASACGSCHLDGHSDEVVWDLGNPSGALDPTSPNLVNPQTGEPRMNHPLKGPMLTQTLRGLRDHAPYHWRADRPQLQSFNGAFEGLLGGEMLSPQEIDAFAAFAGSIEFPPNPFFNRDNSYKEPNRALPGEGPFNGLCSSCHNPTNDGAMLLNGTPLDGGVDFNVPSLLAQLQEVAHFRGLYEKFTSARYTGFGVLHDGREADKNNGHPLQTFLIDFFPSLSMTEREDTVGFITAFPTNVMNVVGWQIRFAGTDTMPQQAANQQQLTTMIEQFAKSPSHCDVTAHGRLDGVARGFVLIGSVPVPQFESDQGVLIDLAAILGGVDGADWIIFSAVPPGSGRRMGVDQDSDGDQNGIDLFPQHANTGDADGNGIVDAGDFIFMRACFGAAPPMAPECEVFDPNGDGVVDMFDANAYFLLYEGQFVDCNANGFLDLLDILQGTSSDLDGNVIPDECPAVSMTAVGSRYLSITVTGDFPVSVMVSPFSQFALPQYVSETAQLVANPVVRLPSEWGTILLGDQDVVPSMFYVVTVESSSWVATDTATTFAWGDVNDTNGVNLDDILCVIAAFSGQFVGCSLEAADLMGFAPNHAIDLDDILAVVAAFGGSVYPGPEPGD